MATNYTKQVLRVVVAQICQKIGWHNIQTTPLEVLTDLLHRYMINLTTQIHNCSELCQRLIPDLGDVALAFQNNNIKLEEISQYVQQVNSVRCALNVPMYPVAKDLELIIPQSINNVRSNHLDQVEQSQVTTSIKSCLPDFQIQPQTKASSINLLNTVNISSNEVRPNLSLVNQKLQHPSMRHLSKVTMSESGEIQRTDSGTLPSAYFPSAIVSDVSDSDDNTPIAHLAKFSPILTIKKSPSLLSDKSTTLKQKSDTKKKKCTVKQQAAGSKNLKTSKKLEVAHSRHKMNIFRRLHIKPTDTETVTSAEEVYGEATRSMSPINQMEKIKKKKKKKKKNKTKKREKKRETGC